VALVPAAKSGELAHGVGANRIGGGQEERPIVVSIIGPWSVVPYVGKMTYSYVLEGLRYSGAYTREFESEEAGLDLQAKAVLVSCDPRNPAKSLLLEDGVNALLASRPPLRGGELRVRVRDVPGWAKPLLWPFIALSAAGLALSFWVHLGAVAGRRVAPGAFFWMLDVGIFVVWIPAVLVSIRRMGSTRRKDY